MPKVNPHQFDGYYFDTGVDNENVRHVLVSRENSTGEKTYPVASMKIDASQRIRNNEEQDFINRGHATHGVATEPGGQMRWTGGTMNDAIDKVSWLGMETSESAIPKRMRPHILRAMLGVAVDSHGSVPHADEELSQYGSNISRAMNRRYGIPPHPNNPTMKPSFSYDEDDAEWAIRTHLADAERFFNLHQPNDWTSYEGGQVAPLAQRLADVAAERRSPKKKKKPETGQKEQLPGMEDY